VDKFVGKGGESAQKWLKCWALAELAKIFTI
jgi:hypothetical protein